MQAVTGPSCCSSAKQGRSVCANVLRLCGLAPLLVRRTQPHAPLARPPAPPLRQPTHLLYMEHHVGEAPHLLPIRPLCLGGRDQVADGIDVLGDQLIVLRHHLGVAVPQQGRRPSFSQQAVCSLAAGGKAWDTASAQRQTRCCPRLQHAHRTGREAASAPHTASTRTLGGAAQLRWCLPHATRCPRG